MNLIFVILLSVLPQDVKVSLLDGSARNGTLSSVTENALILRDGNRDTELAIAEVLSLDFAEASDSVPAGAQRVSLRGGSEFSGSGASKTARDVTLLHSELGELRMPAAAVQSIRIKSDDAAMRVQWETLRLRQTEKDLLVVTRRDGAGLDFLTGIISTVSAEKVEFLLDGETVPVPAARVYGVVFGEAATEAGKTTAAKVKMLTKTGDLLAGEKLTATGGKFEIVMSWGKSISGDVNLLQRVDLSAGRLTYLSDLPALREVFSGVDPEGSVLSGLASAEEQALLFGPRRDMAIQGRTRLRMRGKEYTKGLCVHSRTEIAWALDQKYESLDAIVGIDDEVAFQDGGTHAVRLIIQGDDKVLVDRLVSGKEQPQPLSLPLAGVSTMTVIVDYGDADSICDWLDFGDARLKISQGK